MPGACGPARLERLVPARPFSPTRGRPGREARAERERRGGRLCREPEQPRRRGGGAEAAEDRRVVEAGAPEAVPVLHAPREPERSLRPDEPGGQELESGCRDELSDRKHGRHDERLGMDDPLVRGVVELAAVDQDAVVEGGEGGRRTGIAPDQLSLAGTRETFDVAPDDRRVVAVDRRSRERHTDTVEDVELPALLQRHALASRRMQTRQSIPRVRLRRRCRALSSGSPQGTVETI